MATLRSPLGDVNGSFGNLTTSKWKDQNVIKAKVPRNNTSKSPAQTTQRSRFAALAILGGIFGPAIRIGFRTSATSMTEQNVFQSVNKSAVSMVGGNAVVDMTALKLSAGTVGPVEELQLVYTTGTGLFSVTWNDNSNGGTALPTDKPSVVVYNSKTGYLYISNGVSQRGEGGTNWTDASVAGQTAADFRVYAFFKRALSTSTSPTATAGGEA